VGNIHSSIEGDLATDLLVNYKQLAEEKGISLSELADLIELEAAPVPDDDVHGVASANATGSQGHADVAAKLRAHAEKVEDSKSE
jgi:hypothetical protein